MIIEAIPRKKRVNKKPSRHSLWVTAIQKSKRVRLTIDQARAILVKSLLGTPFVMPKQEGIPFGNLRKALGWETNVIWSRRPSKTQH